jgi:hypothetical protein
VVAYCLFSFFSNILSVNVAFRLLCSVVFDGTQFEHSGKSRANKLLLSGNRNDSNRPVSHFYFLFNILVLSPTLARDQIRHGRLALGTWQGIYLNEHRDQGGWGGGHTRQIIVTLQGQA